jgi:hypothetical protein
MRNSAQALAPSNKKRIAIDYNATFKPPPAS